MTRRANGPGPHTLAIDVGGTGIKASVLDAKGRMAAKRVRTDTPYPFRPPTLLHVIDGLVERLPSYDRISLGFPGVVRAGKILTAPHFGTKTWRGTPLAKQLAQQLERPARILNDAEVQGLGIMRGRGIEAVITLGTGLGTAIFSDGHLTPHMELAHLPFRKGKTFEDYVGSAARKEVGREKWNRRVRRVIEAIRVLLNFDTLHIGGGNAKHVTGDLPRGVMTSSNDAGITGGIRLWDEDVWRVVPDGLARPALSLIPQSAPNRPLRAR